MNKEIDYSSLEVDGIDTKDYPDFCDAYICFGLYTDGTELSENDISVLNDDAELIHKLVFDTLY